MFTGAFDIAFISYECGRFDNVSYDAIWIYSTWWSLVNLFLNCISVK
jgi:hypothetical protein